MVVLIYIFGLSKKSEQKELISDDFFIPYLKSVYCHYQLYSILLQFLSMLTILRKMHYGVSNSQFLNYISTKFVQ